MLQSLHIGLIKLGRKIWSWTPVIITILICYYIVTTFSLTQVVGISMEPTYQNNDIVVCLRHKDTYEKDDIVIVESQDLVGEQYIIKRIIATPGQSVQIKSGKLYVDNKLVDDGYKMSKDTDMKKVTVKKGEVFIMGDNRNNSVDSRSFGAVSQDRIASTVCYDAEWLRSIGRFIFSFGA